MTMLERPSQRHLDGAIHDPASDSLLYRRIRDARLRLFRRWYYAIAISMSPQTSIAQYRDTSKPGEGGMGEVRSAT